MKKLFLVVATLMLFWPLTAAADPVGTGHLKIDYSDPINDLYYYLDYEIRQGSYINKSGAEIEFSSSEVFCVSDDILNNNLSLFSFYTSTDIFEDEDTLNFVTSVANWGADDERTEAEKGNAQMAIWQKLDVDAGGSDDAEMNLFTNDSIDGFSITNAYVNDWLVAINGGTARGDGDDGNQDFLVKAAPVPEPTTMLLFGTGLIGLAGLSRRKRK